MKALQKILPRKKNNLKAVYLSFEGFKQVTTQALKSISLCLKKNLTKITSLSLSFRGCSGIKDEGIEYLSDSISSNLKDLKELCLNFKGCENLTGKCLEFLSTKQALSHKNLKEIHLLFSRCKLIDEASVNMFKDKCSSAKFETILLDFDECYQAENPIERVTFINGPKNTTKMTKSSNFRCELI